MLPTFQRQVVTVDTVEAAGRLLRCAALLMQQFCVCLFAAFAVVATSALSPFLIILVVVVVVLPLLEYFSALSLLPAAFAAVDLVKSN